jgi:peptide/nickel transport system substrate-binding protein
LKISRLFLTTVAGAVLGFGVYFLVYSGRSAPGPSIESPANGGEIVGTYRTEPSSFNRYAPPTPPGAADDLIARLIHATLVRLDRTTGRIEPRLARTWTSSPDGLTWTFALRDDVAFSDGTPFTSTDVVFSFQALYDPRVKSEIASSLLIGGQPMRVRALDAHTVAIVFPSPYAPGISLLDALPILPAHKLRAALEAGTFREAWSITTPLADIVGLGPFVLEQYVPAQRLVFARNPKFWLRDAGGRPLPYLDRLELQFTPDQNAEVLRLQAGEADLMTDRVRVEDLASLQSLSARGQIVLHTAGVSISPDMLWFNLAPGSKSARDRPWLQRDEFRHAVSQAVNRTALVNTVFLGEAVEIAGPITPGHGDWFLPDLPRPAFDPAAAAKALAAMGLIDRNGDGLRDDDRGRTVSFALLTQKGNSVRERSAAMIQEQLRQIGVNVDVVAREPRSMIGQWSTGDYEAIYYAIEFDSFDPARNLEFWLSSGPFHFWHPNQTSPSTSWEARLDALMTQQSTTLDSAERHKLFAEAQRVFAEHEPVLYFAAPKIIVATSARVGGVTPSVLAPLVLWNAERLYVDSSAPGARK